MPCLFNRPATPKKVGPIHFKPLPVNAGPHPAFLERLRAARFGGKTALDS
ncbi:hypothetical protein GGQ85_000980 [Nitrobacter vulgaris]|nr:hypothetical protein [Nitrobacter vulgaris]